MILGVNMLALHLLLLYAGLFSNCYHTFPFCPFQMLVNFPYCTENGNNIMQKFPQDFILFSTSQHGLVINYCVEQRIKIRIQHDAHID